MKKKISGLSSHHQQESAFVTYGWCRTGYSVVRSLGSKGIPVHVGDSSALAMSRFSRYTQSFTRLPDLFDHPEAYFNALCAALVKTGAKVLLPSHEDVELIIKWQDRLPPGVVVSVPTLTAWQTAEDKGLYAEPVRNAGCPVPDTHFVCSEEDLEFLLTKLAMPLVIKARTGNSAKGVRICASKDDCRRDFFDLIEKFGLEPDRWPIIQEHVSGKKFGFLGYFKAGKYVSGIVFEIVRSKGSANFGTSTYRVVVDDRATQAAAISAMEELGWDGVVDMDWIKDEDGVAHLIDINGRLGGATALTVICGMDMPYLWYLGALNRLPEEPPAVRVGAKARWILGDLLGLIDSLRAGRLRESLSVLRPQRHCRHDDLVLKDPLPFVFQILDYGAKFIRGGGSTNPVTSGMLR